MREHEEMPLAEQFALNTQGKKLDEKIERYKRIAKEVKKQRKQTAEQKKDINNRVYAMMKTLGIK
jgi:hypothetical protein